MPRHPDDATWIAFDDIEAAIAAEHEQLRRYVRLSTQRLAHLHRAADMMRTRLGIADVVVDTEPERHLRIVHDAAG